MAMGRTFAPHTRQLTKWARFIPDDEWRVYRRTIEEAHARSIPFALGGAFAMATYTGYWRDTKDLDLYVLPHDRDRTVAILTDLGLKDYYEKQPYDRWWIYRGTKDGSLVDIIWAMANHRQQIDALWLSGPEVEIRGLRVKVLPAEAILWDKLYIMQRERCDWPDVLNLIYWTGPDIDWEYLLGRIGDDWPLLAGALSVFRWISPGKARALPAWLWERLGAALPAQPEPDTIERRVSLLDTRPWYGPDRAKLQPAA